MGFHLLAYANPAMGVNASFTQLSAVPDPEFSNRGTTPAFILSEDYDVLFNAIFAASVTDARFDIARVNAIAKHHIYPINRFATIPTNPNIQDMRDYPLKLPTFEQLIAQASNNLGSSTEPCTLFTGIAPRGTTRMLPSGERRIQLAFTGAVTGVAGAWSSLGNLTFAENLASGWYSVVGCNIFDAGTLAFRMVFARPENYQGRKLRPGGFAQEALGNIPWGPQMGGLGLWGKFHSQEPPQLEIYANASASSAQVGIMDVIFHGAGSPY